MRNRLYSKIKSGNGILIFGMYIMIFLLVFAVMFINSASRHQNGVMMQYAADTVADGTAYQLSTEREVDFDKEQEVAEKVLGVVSDNTAIKDVDMELDKKAYEDQTARVMLTGAFSSPYGMQSYSVSRIAASTFGFAGSYVQWAMAIANDDSHGYSQARRSGNPDYDCSSLVYYSLINTGVKLDIGWPFTTGDMGRELVKAGFKELPYSPSALVPGDIMVQPNDHTEIYIGNGKTVAAHCDEFGGVTGPTPGDQTGGEINISPLDRSYSYIYRMSGSK